jgi:hypothetical protein
MATLASEYMTDNGKKWRLHWGTGKIEYWITGEWSQQSVQIWVSQLELHSFEFKNPRPARLCLSMEFLNVGIILCSDLCIVECWDQLVFLPACV